MKVKIVFLISTVTLIVAMVVFGQAVFEGREIDRSQFAKDKLRVLSYSTFVSSFGPGPTLARQFQQQTGVEVELVNIGDSGLIIQKLTEDPSVYADVILGIDRLHREEAERQLPWTPLPESFRSVIRDDISSEVQKNFVPVTWAPMTFLYKKSELNTVPKDFKDWMKLSTDKTLSLQDPRLSTPGFQFLFWWYQQGQPEGGVSPKGVRISPSWSQSYALYKRGVAQAVFTYLTSIVFHWEAEKDFSHQFYMSEQGHPWQVELAGVSGRCRRCEDGKKFLQFLLQPESQVLLMKKNYMFPAVKGVDLSGAFAKLPEVPLLSYDQLPEFLQQKKQIEDTFFKTFQ